MSLNAPKTNRDKIPLPSNLAAVIEDAKTRWPKEQAYSFLVTLRQIITFSANVSKPDTLQKIAALIAEATSYAANWYGGIGSQFGDVHDLLCKDLHVTVSASKAAGEMWEPFDEATSKRIPMARMIDVVEAAKMEVSRRPDDSLSTTVEKTAEDIPRNTGWKIWRLLGNK